MFKIWSLDIVRLQLKHPTHITHRCTPTHKDTAPSLKGINYYGNCCYWYICNSIYSIITCISLETPEPHDTCKHSSKFKFTWLNPIMFWNTINLWKQISIYLRPSPTKKHSEDFSITFTLEPQEIPKNLCFH